MRAHLVKFIVDNKGEPVENAQVTVVVPGTSTPISSTIYSADSGSSTKTNPFYTEQDGKIELYLEKPQRVELQISKDSFTTSIVEDVQFPALEGIVYKSSSSLVVNNSTTLVDDDSLVIAAIANTTYIIEGLVIYTSTSVADFKCTIAAPSGSTGGWSSSGVSGNSGLNQATGSSSALTALGTTASFGGAGTSSFTAVRLFAVVNTGSSSGNIRLQWAQATAEATNTTVVKGSFLKYIVV